VNVTAILALFNKLADESLTADDIMPFLNDCSSDIAEAARKAKQHTIAFAGGASFTLPSDFMTPVRMTVVFTGAPTVTYVLREASEPYPDESSISYTRWDDTITFEETQYAGTLTLNYYRPLTTLTATSDVPEIPLQFHRIYAVFAAARHLGSPGVAGNPVEATRGYQAEYQQLKAALDGYTNVRNQPTGFRQCAPW
jgi:hypothetical protein